MYDDDFDWDPISIDEDRWEQFRIGQMKPVYDLIDLLIKLKVLGVGWDMDRSSDYNTGTYIDKRWKV